MAKGKYKGNPYIQNLMKVHNQRPGNAYWVMAQDISQKIVADHQYDIDAADGEVPTLVKLGVQAVQGVLFFMTFQVKTQNGTTATYNAQVWVKPANCGFEIMSIDRLLLGESDDKMKVSVYKMPSSPVEEEGRLVFANDSKIRLKGFLVLVEEIRRPRPGWSFKRAQKIAKSKWKKLPEHERSLYMEEAVDKLNGMSDIKDDSDVWILRTNPCECCKRKKQNLIMQS